MTLDGHYTLYCTKHASFFVAHRDDLCDNEPTLLATEM